MFLEPLPHFIPPTAHHFILLDMLKNRGKLSAVRNIGKVEKTSQKRPSQNAQGQGRTTDLA